MTSSPKRLLVLSAAAVTGLMVASCGPGKVAQCNTLAKTVNAANTEVQTIQKENNPDKVGQMSRIATSLDKYSQQVQSLELQDEQLKSFQTRFSTLYKEMGDGSRGVVGALQKKDLKAANQSLQVLQKGAQTESTLVADVNKYCGGS